MDGEGTFSGWSDVDATGDAESFQSYLDAVSGVDSIRALKRRSHRLLSPSAGDRVLDVGCGTGDDVAALADAVGPNGAVVGVDGSDAMVEEARNRASESAPVSFAAGDARALPFADGAFDAARADRVLQHLERSEEAFAELVRVTRPGGRVAVTDSDWGTLAVDAPGGELEALTERILDPEWACAQCSRVGRRLGRWAADAGLERIDVDAETVVLTDLETADEVLGLDGRIDRMVAAGALGGEEADRWLDGLRAADDRGEFFSSLSLYTVAGTAPDGSAE